MPHRVALTGASGFLGSAIAAAAPQGVEIDSLGRRFGDVPWDIEPGASGQALPLDLSGIDSVIHCAWALRPRDARTAARNVNAVRRLLAAASSARFVFVSSMSASDSTTSWYGRSKRAAELLVLGSAAGIVVRPGTIQDVDGGVGMLADTLGSIARLPARPRVAPEPFVPMVSLSRTVSVIWELALGTVASEQFVRPVAPVEPVELVDEWRALDDLVSSVSGSQSRVTVPVPRGLINGAVAATTLLPLPGLRDVADSWRGLMDASQRKPADVS